MGRRDVSFDQDLPVPLGLADSTVTKLNDQHAYLQLGGGDRVEVGSWLGFGISHPCTVFDKWQLIPELDADDRVVGLIRTFFERGPGKQAARPSSAALASRPLGL